MRLRNGRTGYVCPAAFLYRVFFRAAASRGSPPDTKARGGWLIITIQLFVVKNSYYFDIISNDFFSITWYTYLVNISEGRAHIITLGWTVAITPANSPKMVRMRTNYLQIMEERK